MKKYNKNELTDSVVSEIVKLIDAAEFSKFDVAIFAVRLSVYV
jgi:hypothetical protein